MMKATVTTLDAKKAGSIEFAQIFDELGKR